MQSASITKNSQTNFYYAFLFLPRQQRDAIFAVYAFSRLVDDAVDQAPSPEVAAQTITQWREELARTFTGHPSHPVTIHLRQVADQFHIPKAHFELLLDGMEMDLVQHRYRTFDDLSHYCYRVASVIGLICIEIFGYRNPATKEYAVAQGMAFQLTNILRDVQADATQGRIYLPQEELTQFGYSEAELMASRYNQAFVDLMAFQCERARGMYRKAAGLLPDEDRPSMLASQIMSRIYQRILVQIEARKYNVFDRTIRVSTPAKLMIALQTWAKTRWGQI